MADFFLPRKASKVRKIEEGAKKKEIDAEYEKNKRSRKIQLNWLNKFTWLRIRKLSELYPKEQDKVNTSLNNLCRERTRNNDEENISYDEVMVCEPCREKHFNTQNKEYTPKLQDLRNLPFVYGAISFRIESLRKHCQVSNTQHHLAVQREKNVAKEQQNEHSEAQQILLTMSDLQKKQLSNLFVNAYSILKQGKSFSDFEFLLEVDKAKGVNVGSTYHNRQAGVDFGMAIDDVFMKEFRKDFMSAKFFGIIIDESTDASRMEQVALIIRYSVNACIRTRFVAIDNVVRATAEQITEKILDLLKSELYWVPPNTVLGESGEIENIEELVDIGDGVVDEADVMELFGSDNEEEEFVGFGECDFANNNDNNNVDNGLPLLVGMTTDGASVLMGRRKGVQKRMKDKCNRFLVGSHCISHRLQLALKDSADLIKELRDVHCFCEQLFDFHKKSTVISSVYKSACEAFSKKGKHAVIRVNGTRWVAHMVNALENLLNGLPTHKHAYAAIKDQNDYSAAQKAKASYFLSKLVDGGFLSTILFVLDLCKAMSIFSKETQKQNISIVELKLCLESAIANLKRFIDHPNSGIYWSKRSTYGVSSLSEISEMLRITIATSLKECLENRCCDISNIFDEADEVLNISRWSVEDFFVNTNGKLEVTDIFDDNVDALSNDNAIRQQLAEKGVDTFNIKSEWIQLKKKLLSWHSSSSKVFPPPSWRVFLKSVNCTLVPNFIALIDFLLTHSVSSSDAERVFSAMKKLKSKKRTTLGNKLLTMQLRQFIDGPSICKFDPSSSIEQWRLKPSKKNKSGVIQGRRPDFMIDNQHSSFGPKKNQSNEGIEVLDE